MRATRRRWLIAVLAFASPVAPSLHAQQGPPTIGAEMAKVLPIPREADANDWRSYYIEGLKLVRREPRKAEPYFQWASRLNPVSAEPVHMRWVALWLGSGRLLLLEPGKGTPKEEAERARIDSVLLEAVSIDPFTPRHYARWVYEERPGYWREDDLTQGYLAYTEEKYDRAVRLLGRIRKGDRQRTARTYRALSFHAMQRFDSAATELEALAELTAKENAATLTPSYESAAVFHYGVGLERLRLGDTDGARAALERALGEDVSMAAAHAALAQVALKSADTATVLREWAMAIELRPQNGAMHGDYANALRALGRLDEAVAAYERAIEREPYWAAPYFNEAITLDALRRGPDAVRRYGQFLERAPASWEKQVAHAKARIVALNGG